MLNRSRHRFLSIVAIIYFLFTITIPLTNAQSQKNSGSSLPLSESYLPAPLADDLTFVANNQSGVGMGCQVHGQNSASFEIAVDRYVGNVDKLLANVHPESGKKLISETSTIKLSIGGNSSLLDPQQYKWYLNEQSINPPSNVSGIWTLKIDTKTIKFPSDPGPNGRLIPRNNVIRIATGSTNAGTNLCTIINWAALNIEVVNPVILVHGILSDSNAWRLCDEIATLGLETNWMGKLDDMGIPVSAINLDRSNFVDQDSPNCKPVEGDLLTRFKSAQALTSIEHNANIIAMEIESLRRRWHAGKYNFVTHSKGGIDTRDYAEKHDTVDQLIQIGVPNGGSHLADFLQKSWVRKVVKLSTGIDVSSPRVAALSQLTTSSMDKYNHEHGWNRTVTYISLAGDYRYTEDYVLRPALRFFYSGNLLFTPFKQEIGLHDGVVSVESAHSLNYVERLEHTSSGRDTQALHWEMTRSADIYNKLVGYLTARRTSEIQPLRPIPAPAAPRPKDESDVAATEPISGIIYQGQTITRTVMIDNGTDIRLMLYYTEGDIGFHLRSPSGILIDGNRARIDPNYSYNTLEQIGFIQTYGITENVAEVGNWEIVLTGKSVSPEGEYFSVTALLNASTINVHSAIDEEYYRRGEPILLTTTLQDNGQPLTSASATAEILYPDGITAATISLVDNGRAGDKVANDGLYSGLFNNATQSGTYRADITVVGSEQRPFSRSSVLFIPVSISNSRIVGNFTDYGSNPDNDDFYNQLVIGVKINVTDFTRYRIFAELADRNGMVIEQTSIVKALNPGVRKINLNFDGRVIRENGVDGPYQLKVVRLAEQDSQGNTLLLDEKRNAYRTRGYAAEQFQPLSVSVFSDSGSESGRGIRQNHVKGGNGKDTHAIVIDGREAARGLTLYTQKNVCNDFNIESSWSTSHRADGTQRDVYGGWGPSAVNNGNYQANHVSFSKEKTVGPGSSADGGYSVKISSSQPYAAWLGSPIMRVAPGSQVTVKANYLMMSNHSSADQEWVSMGVKPDARGNETQYVNGHARGHWAQLEHTVTAGPTGEIMVLLQAESRVAINSNVYIDDVRIFVNDEPLASCVYESH